MYGILILFFFVRNGECWSMDDFPLFDLVEEVQQTFQTDFYTLFDVSREAKLSEIKKGYRKLSLIHHPDKSRAEDASEKFRQIAAVYEVLKEEESRQKYDEVLENGLPDWRQPIWYFRRVRKMPWWESVLLLLLILTVGHYLMLWGAYFEKRITLLDAVESRFKRKEKMYKRKYNIDVDDLIEDHLKENLEKPHWKGLLPFLMLSGGALIVKSLPSFIQNSYQEFQARRNPPPEPTEEEESVRRRPIVPRQEEVEYELATDLKPVSTSVGTVESDERKDESAADQEWSMEDLSLLIRLSSTKYPVGTPNRWEKIAMVLRRKPAEITTMIGRLKQMDPQKYQELSCYNPLEKKEVPEIKESDDVWTQAQQKLFETALLQFPKGTPERWEKISGCVPGKTKDDCLERFKFLAQMVRNRKATKQDTN